MPAMRHTARKCFFFIVFRLFLYWQIYRNVFVFTYYFAEWMLFADRKAFFLYEGETKKAALVRVRPFLVYVYTVLFT